MKDLRSLRVLLRPNMEANDTEVQSKQQAECVPRAKWRLHCPASSSEVL